MQSSVIAAVACFLKIEIKDFCKKTSYCQNFNHVSCVLNNDTATMLMYFRYSLMFTMLTILVHFVLVSTKHNKDSHCHPLSYTASKAKLGL